VRFLLDLNLGLRTRLVWGGPSALGAKAKAKTKTKYRGSSPSAQNDKRKTGNVKSKSKSNGKCNGKSKCSGKGDREGGRVKKSGPSFEGPICLGSLWLGEVFARAL